MRNGVFAEGRAAFMASMDDYSLPETWVIFITENDVMGKGLTFYPIERRFLGTGER